MGVWFKMASKANLTALLPTSPQAPHSGLARSWAPSCGQSEPSLQISKFWMERPGRCVPVRLEGSHVSSPAGRLLLLCCKKLRGHRVQGQPCVSSPQGPVARPRACLLLQQYLVVALPAMAEKRRKQGRGSIHSTRVPSGAGPKRQRHLGVKHQGPRVLTVTSEECSHPSVPQFPQLDSEKNNSAYLRGMS